MNSKYNQPFALIPYYCCIASFIFISAVCDGQDKIYLENEQRNGKVTEITADKIKYKNPDNPGPLYSITRNKVKLLFNETGAFLVVRKLDSVDTKQAEKMISNFINPPVQKPDDLDKLITLQGKQINCTILNEEDQLFSIHYNDLGDIKYDKGLVAVVIYKDGKHKIVADLSTAVDILSSIKTEKNSKPAQAKAEVTVKKTPVPPVNKEPVVAEEQAAKASVEDKTVAARDEREEKKLFAEQKKARADSIAELNAVNKKYRQAITNAEALYKKEDYSNSKAAYALAASLKPGEQEPRNKIDSINAKLSGSLAYDSLTAVADSLFSIDWYAAVATYKKILELKPADYYSTKQITYLEKEIAKKEEEEKIAEEIRKKKEQEQHYRLAIEKGDAAKLKKNYEEALAAYNDALSIHPENEYAKKMAEIMTYQISLKTKVADNNKN